MRHDQCGGENGCHAGMAWIAVGPGQQPATRNVWHSSSSLPGSGRVWFKPPISYLLGKDGPDPHITGISVHDERLLGIGVSQDWGFGEGCLCLGEGCSTGLIPVEWLSLFRQSVKWAGDSGKVSNKATFPLTHFECFQFFSWDDGCVAATKVLYINFTDID